MVDGSTLMPPQGSERLLLLLPTHGKPIGNQESQYVSSCYNELDGTCRTLLHRLFNPDFADPSFETFLVGAAHTIKNLPPFTIA